MSRSAPWGELSLRIAQSPLFTTFASHLAAGRGRATRLPPAAAAWVFDLIAEQTGRPVVVVTNDQAIVTDVRAAGANVVASDTFLTLARR